ncbi:MAG: hypothetical protein JO105_06270 [Hyphomicrobiales bacterium]|nr:hypothetical protein [Hyphomicrobiales bacterium]
MDDRTRIELQLAQAESRVIEGRRHLERQCEIVTGLERAATTRVESVAHLAVFEESLRLHIDSSESD